MVEKELERKLKKRVEELGCLCLKFESPGYTGVPDRIILLPGGSVVFVEMKAPGRKERPRQKLVHRIFRMLGFKVMSPIDSEAGIDQVCSVCKAMMRGSQE